MIKFLFCFDRTGDLGDDGEVYVCVTSQPFFEQHGHLDDCFRGTVDKDGNNVSEVDPDAINVMPPRFHNSMEAVFEYYPPKGTAPEYAQQQATAALLAAGLVFSPEMDAYING